ncbi:extracellular solute-binding protein [Paenibacillus sp. GP183]|jgi:raffinose/stachyose/melibiose transport system substrate-binding protein|uniref:ABC transporter substrate-binding protein n=1 Tax=Paenibacillus sp. GP183 TaxID=1882751 RepID=UPI0008984D93|nr:extracellular solute-binding protein [Paenibacillus sp. GP183]SEC28769.1 raffinose/stachyose/melibiose transport system substrate-binding protein [Paenibacillus sp. GP183]
MKKTLLTLAAIVMLGTTAACGSSNGGNAANPSGTKGATQTNAPSAALQKVQLKIFLGGLDRFRVQFDSYFAKFAEKEKADKNIEVTFNSEYPGADTAPQILKTRLATGDVPDVFSLHAGNDIPPFSTAGFLTDLSDQPFASKLIPGIKPLVSVNGKVVALPLESVAWGYLYNKKIFNDLGITPPATLTEMKTVVQKLKDNKMKPFLLSYKEAWIPQLFLPLTVGGLVNSTHKDFVSKMNSDQGSFADIKEMFDIIDLVNANGTDRPFEISNDDGSAAFATGSAAMWVQGPWNADSILKVDDKFQLGVAPLPITDNPASTLINTSVSTALAISPGSKNKEVALDLLNYILDDQASNDLYQSLKFNPVSTKHTFKPYPWVEDALVYVNKGQSYQDPTIPSAVKDESGKALQSYYNKSMTKDDIIKDLDKTWKNANAAAKK